MSQIGLWVFNDMMDKKIQHISNLIDNEVRDFMIYGIGNGWCDTCKTKVNPPDITVHLLHTCGNKVSRYEFQDIRSKL